VIGVILLIIIFSTQDSFAISPLPPKDTCIVTGEVTKIYLGEYSSPYYTDNGDLKVNKVKYTSLSMKILTSEMLERGANGEDCSRFKVDELSEIGLCEEQTVLVGDIIKGATDGWANGPDCYVDVEFIKKVKR